MINKIETNNPYQVMFKAERVVYPNEFICDDLERKPDFSLLNKKEEKVDSVKVKKESFMKKMSEMSKNLSEFFKAAKQYYHYRKGVKLATRMNVLTKERAKHLLKEERTILFNILKR